MTRLHLGARTTKNPFLLFFQLPWIRAENLFPRGGGAWQASPPLPFNQQRLFFVWSPPGSANPLKSNTKLDIALSTIQSFSFGCSWEETRYIHAVYYNSLLVDTAKKLHYIVITLRYCRVKVPSSPLFIKKAFINIVPSRLINGSKVIIWSFTL